MKTFWIKICWPTYIFWYNCHFAKLLENLHESLFPPVLMPYWDINRAEASAIFSFPSPRPRADYQRLSSYQIPSSAISIPSNFIFFKSLCGGERYQALSRRLQITMSGRSDTVSVYFKCINT